MNLKIAIFTFPPCLLIICYPHLVPSTKNAAFPERLKSFNLYENPLADNFMMTLNCVNSSLKNNFIFFGTTQVFYATMFPQMYRT